MRTQENSTLNMQDTIAFFKKLLTAPHLAYAEALSLFTQEQRWRYFRFAMAMTAVGIIVPSILALMILSSMYGIVESVLFVLLCVFIVVSIYVFNVRIAPNLLHLVGGWFKGQASVEELRDLSIFNYFVWVSLGALSILSIFLFPLSLLISIVIQILCLVFYIKGLQYVQKYDLLDAFFTVVLSYAIVMVVFLVCSAIVAGGFVSLVGIKSSLLGI